MFKIGVGPLAHPRESVGNERCECVVWVCAGEIYGGRKPLRRGALGTVVKIAEVGLRMVYKVCKLSW